MAKYDESAVVTLDALSHIRLRSGMYIGRLGDGSHPDDGIYILLKEVVDNSIDEFIMGHGKSIQITCDITVPKISIRDFGRGIPLGKVLDCVQEINTGAKYNDEVFQFSVGLNGVGLKAVNALSSHFMVRSVRDGQFVEASFVQGKLVGQQQGKIEEKNGTYIEFTPDKEIFGKYAFVDEYIVKRVQYYSYLNSGLTLVYNGVSYTSKLGLLDLLESEVNGEEKVYEPLYAKTKHVEFAFLHNPHYGEEIYSFVNGQHTSDGGTHVFAFRDGLVRALNEFSKKNLQSIDVREGLTAALLVKIKDPVFESQTKNKLGNTDIKSSISQEVRDAVLELLFKYPDTGAALVERIQFNERLRKELQAVRKDAKEKQKKIAIKIPKLRDCKVHLHEDPEEGEASMIFITEGDSASASIIASRNPKTQAVFPLRGKPLNVWGMRIDQLYKNEELFHLMSALKIEQGIESLRYNKVILATDADVDGMHIRNLLITFFLTYFEPLVVNGHVYILETPLFKVRSKDRTEYCYSEQDKEALVKKWGEKHTEVTRFKGLGEISPQEFGQFIDHRMKIEPVQVNHFSDIHQTLEFYMGKNTPQRKQFIMENLIKEEV